MARMHSTVSRYLRRALWAVLLLALVMAAGCESLGYYSHLALGQLGVLRAREPVPEVMAELAAQRGPDSRPSLLYRRLDYSQRVLGFAEQALGLPVNDRYRTYVDLQRPAVVWNSFAAPMLSLEPFRWCYPFVGCAPYRGYFDQERALREAAELREEGYETFVGAVPAYSTLGWFADPLLSSFISWPEPDLAELLFHELAHGAVWVTGDVDFNESFATFVGRQGLASWLEARDQREVLHRQLELWRIRRRVLTLLDDTRAVLESIYRSDRPDWEKRVRKRLTFRAAQACYARERDELAYGRFDFLMAGLNNARLVSIATYEHLVPAFERVFAAAGGDWPAFFARVEALAQLPADDRARRLAASAEQQVAEGGDDGDADEIECEALFRHLLDGEPAGGIDDDVGGRGHR